MTPKISIIVPAYNAEAYISECLDRLCAIDYPDFEIIVVNDGSTDRTEELVKARAESVRLISQANAGLSGARNTGLANANGEFVLFCDADDYYSPDSLTLLFGWMSDDVDIVAAQLYSKTRRRKRNKAQIVTGTHMAMRCLYQKPLYQNSACAKLYRKALFSDLPLFKEGTWYEDLEISLRLFAAARKVVVTDAEVYFYRQHAGSFLHRWNRGRLDSLKVTESLVNQAAQYGSEMERAARSRRYSAAWNLLLPALRHGEKDVAAQCRQIIRQSRQEALADPQVRPKNKLAALLSYLII